MSTPQENLQRNLDIEACFVEATAISKKPRLTKQDEVRAKVLFARISALKAGFSPTEVRLHELHQVEQQMGKPFTELSNPSYTAVEADEARAWREYVRTGTVEQRVGEIGQPAITYEKLGSFVPVEFFTRLSAALKEHDPLFDPELVSYVETQRGGMLHAPVVSDLTNVAEPISESGDDSGDAPDLSSTGHAESKPKSYRTPLWYVSVEAEQDLEAFLPAVRLAQYFFTDRMARGVGRDLVKGDGLNGRILGIVQQLALAGDLPIVAQGSAANTGGSETGANSIGTKDLAKLYTSVDQAYRKSPRAAWLVNDNTLAYLLGLLDKNGRPIVKQAEGYPYIYGKPVLVSPSLDDIGASNTPILFGDWRYFLLHCARSGAYVQRYWEAPGLVENGVVGLRAFARYDGQLLWKDATNSKSPIRQLQNAS